MDLIINARGFDDPILNDDEAYHFRPAPKPATSRERATFFVTTMDGGCTEDYQMSRFGLTVEFVIAEQGEDISIGLDYCDKDGDSREAFIKSESDKVVWSDDNRVVAIVRPTVDGPKVIMIG